MRRAVLVYNPAAGPRRRHGARLPAVLEALRAGGIAAVPAPTGHPGHATELARAAVAGGEAGIVIAWGGDGTVRETAAGLVGTPVALGVLPGGTTNVVSIAFGLGRNPLRAARRLGGLEARPIDVGLCDGRPFLMQASCGLESYLMHRVHQGPLKSRLGLVGIVLHSLPVMREYGYPEIEVVADGRALRATGAMVCNISEVAGPYRMIPDGRFDDGRLELLVFRGRGMRAVVGFAADLFIGRHPRRRDVEILPVERVSLAGPPGTFVQIDGDAISLSRPVEVRLAEARLMALVEPGRLSRRSPGP
jgi:diacylglycerol kinase family enzyme